MHEGSCQTETSNARAKVASKCARTLESPTANSMAHIIAERITEADWRLFTTLIRFDAVYVGHFKCNIRRIADYKNLSRYLRELYALPGVAETVNFLHIKRHYYQSHPQLNPSGIVPVGPELELQDDPGVSVA